MTRWWLVSVVIALGAGCAEQNPCQGDPPYAQVCTCPGTGGGEAVQGYLDADGDGVGSGARGWFCAGGYASADGDCDDGDASLNLADRDGDGVTTCGDGGAPGDCDDGDATVFPGAEEVCDGVDNDCDGSPAAEEVDADGDGVLACGAAGGEPDCDDADPATYPGAEEVCDGVDNDCDGVLPEEEEDADGDGFPSCSDCDDGDPALTPEDADGDGYSTCDGDCDDGDAEANLDDLDGDGFTSCDGDCNDYVNTLSPADADGDGYSTCDEDCDDGDATVFPEPVVTAGWRRDCAPLWAADVADAAWYDHRVESPSVADDGATVSVFYATGVQPGERRIGVIRSTDLATWTDDGAAVLAGTGDAADWDGDGVRHPAVVYDPADAESPYKLYYSAVHPVDGTEQIGLAISSDGVTFTRTGDGDPVVGVGAAGDADAVAAAAPYVWLDGGGYSMLYACSDGVDAGICLATSDDGGATWDKWDPAPGVAPDPQPLWTSGDAGAADEQGLSDPLPLWALGHDVLLASGFDGAVWSVGAAALPGVAERASPLDAWLPRALQAASQAGRFDDLSVRAGDVIDDGADVWLLYGGARADAGVEGGEVVSIGVARDQPPALTLSEPASDPVVMAAGDEVTFTGSVADTEALDEILILVSSEEDDGVLLTTLADASGSFSLTAPGGTFVAAADPYTITISAIDRGGLTDGTSIALDVSP